MAPSGTCDENALAITAERGTPSLSSPFAKTLLSKKTTFSFPVLSIGAATAAKRSLSFSSPLTIALPVRTVVLEATVAPDSSDAAESA